MKEEQVELADSVAQMERYGLTVAAVDERLARAEIAALLSLLRSTTSKERIIGLAIDSSVCSMSWCNQVYRLWRTVGHMGTLVPVYEVLQRDGSTSGSGPVDYLILHLSLHRIEDLHPALLAAYHMLNTNGNIIVGFVDNRQCPRDYLSDRGAGYSVHKVLFELSRVGFGDVEIRQTNFDVTGGKTSELKEGFGEGAFVVIKSVKGRAYAAPRKPLN